MGPNIDAQIDRSIYTGPNKQVKIDMFKQTEWSKLVQIGPNWSNMVQNGPKSTNKSSKLVQHNQVPWSSFLDSWYRIGTPESYTYERTKCCPYAFFCCETRF